MGFLPWYGFLLWLTIVSERRRKSPGHLNINLWIGRTISTVCACPRALQYIVKDAMALAIPYQSNFLNLFYMPEPLQLLQIQLLN